MTTPSTTLGRITVRTEIGPLLLTARGSALHRIDFPPSSSHDLRDLPGFVDSGVPDEPGDRSTSQVLHAAASQLAEYFARRRTEFDLPYDPDGTPFQRNVWEALARIPYGDTLSYAELAALIGRPRAVRAVGAANGANPLPIVLPCHRVVGSDGTLTGYAGGLATKQRLLELERLGG